MTDKEVAASGQLAAASGGLTFGAVNPQSSTTSKSVQHPMGCISPPAQGGKQVSVLRAALYYARRGLPVLPLHEPLFDDAGKCVGCSCEEYARSERNRKRLEARGLGHRYDPHYVCPQPGKHPRGDLTPQGVKNATTDAATIRGWWARYPTANVGVAGGEILALDADLYKDTYAGDLGDFDENTVTVITGSGGVHLWYLMPTGKEYGNGTGDLPDGIDIRGKGGFVVAPPSLHPSGRRYVFEEGYGPHQAAIAPLPTTLGAQLDAAAKKTAKARAVAVAFDAPIGDKPDLACWNLPASVLERIEQPAPRGQRSEADASTCTALVYAGLTDDEIRAVFSHYPCGREGKYRERGDNYLARTISRAREWVAAHPPPVRLTHEQIGAVQSWIVGPEAAAALRAAGVKRVEPYRKTLAGLLHLAEKAGGAATITPGLRKIADETQAALSSISRHLATLFAGGLVNLSREPVDDAPWTIELAFAIACVSGTPPQMDQDSICDRCSTYARYSALFADDAFLGPYPYTFAERWHTNLPMMARSLTPADALVWAALEEHGEMTRAEIVEETGATPGGVAGSTRRLLAVGLVERERIGRSFVYRLLPTAGGRLEELRQALPTYGLAEKRKDQRLRTAISMANARGEEERAARMKMMRAGLRREAAARGLNLDAKCWRPGRSEKGKAAAGTAEQWARALARGRRMAASGGAGVVNVEVDLYWPQVESRGGEFNAWMLADGHEPGWAMTKSRLDIVRHYKRFLAAEAAWTPPPVRLVGERMGVGHD